MKQSEQRVDLATKANMHEAIYYKAKDPAVQTKEHTVPPDFMEILQHHFDNANFGTSRFDYPNRTSSIAGFELPSMDEDAWRQREERYSSLVNDLLPPRAPNPEITRRLATLSELERAKLDRYFRELVQHEPLGQVLFFDKPAVNMFPQVHIFAMNPSSPSTFVNPCVEEARRSGEAILQEYFGDLLTFHISQHQRTDRAEGLDIWVANPVRCRAEIEANLDIFRDAVGADLTSDQIWQRIVDDQFNVLLRHDAATGIIFGYGRRDALMVHRLGELQSNLSGDPEAAREIEELIATGRQTPSSFFSDPEVIELIALSGRVGGIGYNTWAGDEERIATAKKIAREQYVIRQLLLRPEFLEHVLERMCCTT